ncbi:MAG: 16S rRNA (uracil(1498)-N(3))-methyltransferase [Bacteroidetes bacterium RIFCSPLOWO2_12_FULL_35_15]|nr:MAG: 16S rRNA (uracil(1498)-N(3))-methyltransferase [Bacteroidetes bacterium RIFCSPLOWO2_12_FULL_35_15]
MHLFYTPDITTNTYLLNEEESRHAIRVLRLHIGDKIQLIDGKGGLYVAEIIDDNQKHCSVRITDTKTEFLKRDWYLQIAIAPTKNMDRLEWFIEKATEIGINEISLINCNKSERTIVKAERLNKVAISAIKQSMKAYLPKINDVVDLKKFIISTKDFDGQKFIAHCHDREILPHIKTFYKSKENVIILIGPEGDFSIDEIKLALENGYKEISLGESRLRTETAALYACTAANILNEN